MPSSFSRLLLGPRFWPTAIAIYLLLRLPLLLFVDTVPWSDAEWYFIRGAELAETGAYREAGFLTAYWPVGYPAALGALFFVFGKHVIVGQLGNLVFGLATLLGAHTLAKRFGVAEAAARLCVLGLAIYPNAVGYTNLLLSEVFYTAVLIWGCVLATKATSHWQAIVAGVLFGVATLTKTQTMLFPAIWLFSAYWFEHRTELGIQLSDFVTWVKRNLVKGALIYLGLVAVVAPWTVRNYQTFGAFIPVSTNGGTTLFTGNHPNATGDESPRDNPLEALLQVPWEQRVERQVERDAETKRIAMNWIRENPGSFLKLVPKKLFRLWAPDGEGEWGYQAGYAGYEQHRWVFRAARYLNQGYYLLVLGLAAVTAWGILRHRKEPRSALSCLAFPFFVSCIAMVFSGQSRFHYPAMPFLMILATLGAAALLTKSSARADA